MSNETTPIPLPTEDDDPRPRPIGIIAAMDVELDLLSAMADDVLISSMAGIDVIDGSIHGAPVSLVRCGVGKVNAAIAAQALIDRRDVSCLVNTGVAGAIAPSLKAFDVVVATACQHHDMNVQALGYEQGSIPSAPSVFPAGEELSARISEIAGQTGVHVERGLIVSGDIFVSDPEIKGYIQDNFGAAACDMESAAIAQACAANDVPFAIVRVISDGADGDAGSYEEFEEKAAGRSARIVAGLLKEIGAGDGGDGEDGEKGDGEDGGE